MASSRVAVALGLVTLLVSCGGSSTRSPGEAPSGACEYAGKSYNDGESFKSSDGCNTCSCEAGEVSCTLADCVDGCSYGGQQYAIGETFRLNDDCNTCTCGADGQVSCTDTACAPSCEDISAQYGALMEQVKICDPSQPNQCTLRVFEGLRCGCDTFVNPAGYEEIAARELAMSYSEGDCGQGVVCGPCNTAVRGICAPEGVCVTDSEPTEGVACRVGNQVYPNGASGVPDPTSCNACSCDEGQLSCDDASCPKPCPAQTTRATSCAQCGPAGGCEVIETGCLPTCTDSCENGSCVDGVCVMLCR
jgi:hypothetical protein